MVFALGLCLIISPNALIKIIAQICGLLVIVAGVCSMANYLFVGFESFGLIKGICELGCGIALVCLSNTFASPEFFAIISGTIVMLSGLFKIQTAIDLNKLHFKNWWTELVYAIILVVLSILILAYPFESQRVFLIFLGITMVVYAVLSCISAFVIRDKFNKVEKEITEEKIDI